MNIFDGWGTVGRFLSLQLLGYRQDVMVSLTVSSHGILR